MMRRKLFDTYGWCVYAKNTAKFHGLTSSVRAFGGGGKVALSILRSLALRAPLEDLAFFPMVNFFA
jgi:hypothetical protein